MMEIMILTVMLGVSFAVSNQSFLSAAAKTIEYINFQNRASVVSKNLRL